MASGTNLSRAEAPSLEKTDRRGAVRHPMCPEASHVALLADACEPFAGKIRDISQDGIGLVLHGPHEPGSHLSVNVSSKTGLFARTLEMRALRVLPQEDGSYLVGGVFVSKLSGEELEALLR